MGLMVPAGKRTNRPYVCLKTSSVEFQFVIYALMQQFANRILAGVDAPRSESYRNTNERDVNDGIISLLLPKFPRWLY